MATHLQGERIAGRYKVLSILGSGGLGRVYLCDDLQTQTKVAIKRLREDIPLPPDVIEQTKREATLLSTLHHRNIIKVFDLGIDPHGLYFVFEFIDGPTLANLIKNGPVPLDTFLGIAFQSLEGLGAAHRKGLLHLDIKPANIMLHQYPSSNFTVKLLDFGLSKLATEMTDIRKDELTIGSVYYISPEQLEHLPLQPCTDIYSLGHVLYHAYCGHVPFNDPDPVAVRFAHMSRDPQPLHTVLPNCPAELSQWIHWLMAREPHHRPPSAQAALAALTKITLKLNMAKSPPSSSPAATPKRRTTQFLGSFLRKILPKKS